jgi:hypothetical protein
LVFDVTTLMKIVATLDNNQIHPGCGIEPRDDISIPRRWPVRLFRTMVRPLSTFQNRFQLNGLNGMTNLPILRDGCG